jgi:hypothetical protein
VRRPGTLYRLVRAVFAALIAAEALYLVAMNVFLATPLFGKVINATPDVVDIHYSRAWSLYPTHITAKNLSIRASDSHVEWVLRLDDVTFDCSLFELATKKKFHALSPHGTGISFRLRMKLESPAAVPDYVAKLPVIDTLGPVSFVPSDPPYPGVWDDSKWHLFTVQLDDVVAEHVRELWINTGRFEGDARIAGGFFLRPIRRVEVGPVRIDVRQGKAEVAGRTVFEPLQAGLDFKLDSFDPRTASNSDILHGVSVSMDGSGAIPALENLPVDLGHDAQLWGPVELPRFALRLQKGVIRDGTRIDAKTSGVRGTTATHVVSVGAALHGEVTGGELNVALEVEDVDADFALKVPRATLHADAHDLDLEKPLGDLHVAVDVPEARLADARRLMDWLPKGETKPSIAGGSLVASGHGEAWRADDRVRGEVKLTGRELDLRAKDLRARGGSIVAKAEGDFKGHVGRLSVGADAPRLGVEYAGRRVVTDLEMKAETRAVNLDEGTLAVVEANAIASKLDVFGLDAAPAVHVEHLTVTAMSPRVVLADPLARLDVTAAIQGGRIPKASALRDLLPDAPALSVGDDDFGADLALAIRAHVARGAATVHARGVEVRGDKLHLGGNAEVSLSVDHWNVPKTKMGGTVRATLDHMTGGFGDDRSNDFVAEAIELHAGARDLDLAEPSLRDLDYGVRVGHAELYDARKLNTFLPSPQILAVESGSAVLTGAIETGADHKARGELDVLLARGGLRLHDTHFLGDFALRARARDIEASTDVIDLEGSSLAMRNVTVTGATTDTSAWQGDLVLQEGSLHLAGTPRLEGDFTLDARDANPLLAMLLRDTAPKFVAALTQMPHLSVSTHLVVEPKMMVVSDLFGGGGDLALRGVYVVKGDDRRAAFVVQKGPLSAGLGIGNDGAHLRLFGLRDWFDAERVTVLAGTH